MTREEAKQWLEWIKRKYIHGGDEEFDYKRKVALDMAIKALEQEPILEKIWNIVFPLSIMSTDKMEHEAIMQIAEMLEPLYLPESEEEE